MLIVNLYAIIKLSVCIGSLLRIKVLPYYIANAYFGRKYMAKEQDKAGKKGRKSYLNDIQQNLSGEYIYTGAHWSYVPEGKSYPRAVFEIVIFSLLSLAAVVSAGLVRAGGMGNCFYVLFPYIAELIAVFTLELAVYKLAVKGKKLRAYEYSASVEKIPVRAMLSAVFAGIGIVCIIIFVIINGIDGSFGEIILLFCAKAVGIAAPLFLRRLMGALRWKKD